MSTLNLEIFNKSFGQVFKNLLFSESVMRKLLAKYSSGEWVSFYNNYVQEHLMKELDVQPCVHILDWSKRSHIPGVTMSLQKAGGLWEPL